MHHTYSRDIERYYKKNTYLVVAILKINNKKNNYESTYNSSMTASTSRGLRSMIKEYISRVVIDRYNVTTEGTTL